MHGRASGQDWMDQVCVAVALGGKRAQKPFPLPLVTTHRASGVNLRSAHLPGYSHEERSETLRIPAGMQASCHLT